MENKTQNGAALPSHDLLSVWLGAWCANYQSAAASLDTDPDPEDAAQRLGFLEGIKYAAASVFYGRGEHLESMGQFFGFDRSTLFQGDPLDDILSGKVPIPPLTPKAIRRDGKPLKTMNENTAPAEGQSSAQTGNESLSDVPTCSLWIHRGDGHYTGSLVIVCAENKEDAEVIIREQLDKSGLKNEPLDVTKAVFSKNSVIVCDDGDY